MLGYSSEFTVDPSWLPTPDTVLPKDNTVEPSPETVPPTPDTTDPTEDTVPPTAVPILDGEGPPVVAVEGSIVERLVLLVAALN